MGVRLDLEFLFGLLVEMIRLKLAGGEHDDVVQVVDLALMLEELARAFTTLDFCVRELTAFCEQDEDIERPLPQSLGDLA